MIHDRIESFINELISLTENNKLNWQFIDLFISTPMQKTYAFEQLMMEMSNEFTELHKENSFFMNKEGNLLFLLNRTLESGLDGSKRTEYKLFGISKAYSELLDIPTFHELGDKRLSKLKEKIENYISSQKEMPYRLYEFLDNITSIY